MPDSLDADKANPALPPIRSCVSLQMGCLLASHAHILYFFHDTRLFLLAL